MDFAFTHSLPKRGEEADCGVSYRTHFGWMQVRNATSRWPIEIGNSKSVLAHRITGFRLSLQNAVHIAMTVGTEALQILQFR